MAGGQSNLLILLKTVSSMKDIVVKSLFDQPAVSAFFDRITVLPVTKGLFAVLLLGLLNACGTPSESNTAREEEEARASTSKPEPSTGASGNAATVSLSAEQ